MVKKCWIKDRSTLRSPSKLLFFRLRGVICIFRKHKAKHIDIFHEAVTATCFRIKIVLRPIAAWTDFLYNVFHY